MKASLSFARRQQCDLHFDYKKKKDLVMMAVSHAQRGAAHVSRTTHLSQSTAPDSGFLESHRTTSAHPMVTKAALSSSFSQLVWLLFVITRKELCTCSCASGKLRNRLRFHVFSLRWPISSLRLYSDLNQLAVNNLLNSIDRHHLVSWPAT